MTYFLLGYLSADYDEGDVAALRALVARLAMLTWLHEPPRFVDETDDESATQPEDEPVRTVGVALPVREASVPPVPTRAEVARMIDALAEFSAERGAEFEVQLGDTYVGEIRHGASDRLLLEGLLATW